MSIILLLGVVGLGVSLFGVPFCPSNALASPYSPVSCVNPMALGGVITLFGVSQQVCQTFVLVFDFVFCFISRRQIYYI